MPAICARACGRRPGIAQGATIANNWKRKTPERENTASIAEHKGVQTSENPPINGSVQSPFLPFRAKEMSFDDSLAKGTEGNQGAVYSIYARPKYSARRRGQWAPKPRSGTPCTWKVHSHVTGDARAKCSRGSRDVAVHFPNFPNMVGAGAVNHTWE